MSEYQSSVELQTTLPLDEQVWQTWLQKNRARDRQQAALWRWRGAVVIVVVAAAALIYFAFLRFVP